jgi:hypothetical protein
MLSVHNQIHITVSVLTLREHAAHFYAFKLFTIDNVLGDRQ